MKYSRLVLKLQGLVAIMLLALTLAACGSNSTPTAAPQPSATAQSTTAPAATTVATTAGNTQTAATAASTTAAATTAAVAANSNVKTEITIADGVRQGEMTLLKAQIADFQKAYPNIKVTSVHYNPEELGELVKLAVGTDRAPTLIIAPSDYVVDWQDSKALQPLDKVLDPALLKSYPANALGASQISGTQWGVPYTYGNVPVLLYNRKLVPTPPATTDEMIAMAKKLEDDKSGKLRDKQLGMAMDMNQPTWFMAWLGGFGGSVLDANNQPTLNTPEMVKALQFYQDLAYKDKVGTPNYEFGMNQLDYAFRDGRMGMLVSGDWAIPAYGSASKKQVKAAATIAPTTTVVPTTGAASIEVTPGATDYGDKFELGVAPLPKVSATGKAPAPLLDNKAMFIGAQVKGDQLNAAKTFIQFLGSAEQQQAMIDKGFLPTTQTALASEDVKSNPILSGLAAQLAVAKPLPPVIEMRAIWDAILPNLQAVTANEMKPQEAAKKMQELALQKFKLL